MKDVDFESTYADLPERFYTRMQPTPVARPVLVAFNQPLADELGLDGDVLTSTDGIELLAGNRVADDSRPLAMAYAGHQFGNFVPQLGDGRAILLGEVVDRGGRRRDIQLKGAGPTPYSRNGDGRAALGPVLREYIVSEAMATLDIPTTRSLAAVQTGERVFRDKILPGAILTRVARSHVRVGTFQYFVARGDGEAVRVLADYVIQRHYPEIGESQAPYLELLKRVVEAQALRGEGRPTVPSRLSMELATNPFLRCGQPELLDALRAQGKLQGGSSTEVFATVRGWKDHF